ncbi:TraB/GumN family protein [Sphingomicrobium sp. XHP0239]|uniref:TraB/GumN family protein n=1 Tax=Sphingomicrobium maritimum TaxID=3133972 RepID=UPI0031CC833A
MKCPALLAALASFGLGACTATNGLDEYDSSRAVSIDAPRSAAARAEAVDPALWQVADGDTTIYILGTFAMLPEEYEWRTRTIDAAIAASDTLVLETRSDPEGQRALGERMAAIGLDRNLPPLLQRVDPALRPTLSTLAARTGVTMQTYDVMENWAAAITLMGAHSRTLGLTELAGTDPDLRAAFAEAGKPIDYLATNDDQLALYDGLSVEAQRALLESAILTNDELKADFGDRLAAWTRGDLAAIDGSFNRYLEPDSALREAVLTLRNTAWVQWIRARLATPGAVFLAVPANHLVGEDSLLTMLERNGLAVSRLDE